jgi:hypothetical protein
VNPLAPEVGWLYDARGGFVGVARNWGRVRRDDAEGLQRQFAEKNKWKAAHIEEARRLAAPITREAVGRQSAVNAIFGGAPVTDRERQLDRRMRTDGAEAAEDILSPQPAQTGQGLGNTSGSGEAVDAFLDQILEQEETIT